MSDAVVSFVVEKLGEWLIQEAKLLYGVHKEVRHLKDQLQRLRCFLKDADAKQHVSESVRHCVTEIRDIAYDAEDLIETFALKVESRKGGGLKRVASILREAVARCKISSEIKEITTRLSQIKSSLRELGIQEIIEREESSSSQERRREKRQTFPSNIEKDLVGLEQSIEDLAVNLVDEEKEFQVISICGMGGIGKTTLARQVFHHDKVRRHFDRFAWVYVSQQCRRTYVWREILLSVSPKDEQSRILNMRDEELAAELCEFLQNNKCVIVLDDIWRTDDWDLIKIVFLNRKGCKIILTSRNEDVASHADPRGILFKAKCLDHEKSWELLEKMALDRRDRTELKTDGRIEVGKQMVKQCGGLPLALRLLGGILATKHTLEQWQKVHDDIKSYIARGIGSEPNSGLTIPVLSLSYDDLPLHLKQCFLYLGLFPEDYEIYALDLFNYWIGEGLVTPEQRGENDVRHNELEDVAETYLEDLIKRSMVLVGQRNLANSRIKTCRLHDLMRDVCLKKAEEESFLQVVNHRVQVTSLGASSPLSTGKFRRLAVHLEGREKNETEVFCQQKIKGPHVRSLLYIVESSSAYKTKRWALSAPTFRDFGLLRVLNYRGAQFDGGKLSEDIGKLIHLRYLNLNNTNLSELPSSLGNLRLLVTLYLDIHGQAVHVPNVIRKMQRLRRLWLPNSLSGETKLELGNLVNLVSLWNFSMEHCNAIDLFNLTNLRSLSIRASQRVTVPSSLGTVLKYLREFSVIRSLQSSPVDTSWLLSGFVNLDRLTLWTRIEKLPDEFPPNISNVCLWGSGLEKDPMPTLEKLPNLRILWMTQNAFLGREMVCSRNGFPKLLSLQVDGFQNMVEWTVEEGAMPLLRRLEIISCRRLEKIPDGLRFLKGLEELKIRLMTEEFKGKLIPGGEDYDKVQHIPSVVFESCVF